MSIESLQMPTYGGYVWSCYGLTLVALVWLAWTVRRRWQDALTQARRRTELSKADINQFEVAGS